MPVTNPFYQNTFSGAAGQIARAEDVDSQLGGIQAAFDAMLATIRGQTGETMGTLPDAASRANLWLKFDASGNPVVVTTPLNVRGNWQANTAYSIGDAYNASPNGSLYYVLTAYTSGATFGSTDIANTEVVVSLAGLFFCNYTIVSGPATITAVSGNSYLLDSSGGNITVNLPTGVLGASPINITYLNGTLTGSQLQTVVSATGEFIMGSTENTLSMDTVNYSVSLFYSNATYGWRLRTMG